MNQEELNKKIELHQEWLNSNKKKGKKLNLNGEDLSRFHLKGSLAFADLSNTNLSWIKLSCNLYRANLRGANLSYANLKRAFLYGANLSGANLKRANLIEADLQQSNLIGADLRHADLNNADLSYANLLDANLENISLITANLYKITLPKNYKIINSTYLIIANKKNKTIKIGCKYLTLESWEKNGIEIASKQQLTKEQIETLKDDINLIKLWFEN